MAQDMLGAEADYAAKEAELQAELDNMESLHPGYDEYRYNLDPIGHNPHELAAYLSTLLHEHTPLSAAAQLQRVFDLQYVLTLTEEVEIRYLTETSTDPATGKTTGKEVPYEYYILHVELVNTQIAALAPELLTPDEYEMYQVYIATKNGTGWTITAGYSPAAGTGIPRSRYGR